MSYPHIPIDFSRSLMAFIKWEKDDYEDKLLGSIISLGGNALAAEKSDFCNDFS
jgi:hypothetical protein